MKVIDLTHTIREDMPVYPGTETPGGAGSDDCRPIVVHEGQIGWPARSSGNIILRSQSTSGLTIR